MTELALADPGQWTGNEPEALEQSPAQNQELESLEHLIDALPDEAMPGEMPVSLDGQTGRAIGRAGQHRGPQPAPDLTRLSVNNPLSISGEFDGPDDALALSPSPSTSQPPGQNPDADEARNWPQFRLRPTSELDRQVYAVQKSLGVDVETALAIAQGGAGGEGRTAIADLPGLEAEVARVRALSEQTGQALAAQNLSAEESAALESQAAEAQVRLAELENLRGPLAEAREAVEAEFESHLARVAQAYPDLAEAESPLRRAMADVQARWEVLGEWEKLDSPRKPLLAVAEARQELLLNPARYARTASHVEGREIPSYEYPRMRPAPGRVGAHPAAPTRFGEMVAGLGSTHDLEELLSTV